MGRSLLMKTAYWVVTGRQRRSNSTITMIINMTTKAPAPMYMSPSSVVRHRAMSVWVSSTHVDERTNHQGLPGRMLDTLTVS